jgi:hypothetical protein
MLFISYPLVMANKQDIAVLKGLLRACRDGGAPRLYMPGLKARKSLAQGDAQCRQLKPQLPERQDFRNRRSTTCGGTKWAPSLLPELSEANSRTPKKTRSEQNPTFQAAGADRRYVLRGKAFSPTINIQRLISYKFFIPKYN